MGEGATRMLAGLGAGNGTGSEGGGAPVPLALQPPLPEARLSLPEAVAAGRIGLPPEGLALPGDGRWQSGSRPCSPRTLRWVKNGFSPLKLPLPPPLTAYIVPPVHIRFRNRVSQLETFPWSCLHR